VVEPQLVVLSAAMQGRLTDVEALGELRASWPLALGGAGVTERLARESGARHLRTDPLTAAGAIDTRPDAVTVHSSR
jgi:hypothetical protein